MILFRYSWILSILSVATHCLFSVAWGYTPLLGPLQKCHSIRSRICSCLLPFHLHNLRGYCASSLMLHFWTPSGGLTDKMGMKTLSPSTWLFVWRLNYNVFSALPWPHCTANIPWHSGSATLLFPWSYLFMDDAASHIFVTTLLQSVKASLIWQRFFQSCDHQSTCNLCEQKHVLE